MLQFYKEFYSYICSYDKYGYKFSFNFKGKGTQYNTLIGGIATLTMYTCLLILFGYQIDKMQKYNMTAYSVSTSITNFE